MRFFLCVLIILWVQIGFSGEVSTNTAIFSNPPSWLTGNRVNRVVDRIQKYMEWDIRKVRVTWYNSQEVFQKFHKYDSSVLAVSQKQDNSIHIGPRVTASNFDSVFGHELVHIILFQKFKEAIPKWLEEGLANYIARQGTVDYTWLSSQPLTDVKSLNHPFLNSGNQVVSPRFHYQASTGLIEMIASKCSLNDLLQLSVGQNLESYLSTFCNIKDVNSEFQKWIKKKSM